MSHERSIAERKSDGAHYTPGALAEFVAREITGALGNVRGTTRMRVLDPSVGDGSLLAALLRELRERGIGEVRAFGIDTSASAVAAARARLNETQQADVELVVGDFLACAETRESLFAQSPLGEFDVVIANPPYVRTQVLGAHRSQALSDAFALSGRTDLYHAFVRSIARVLRPDGVAGIIVSNRFMTTQAGRSLRTSIPEDFDIEKVFDFGDTKLFDAAVLPAVLLLRRRGQRARSGAAPFVSIYSDATTESAPLVSSVFAAIQREGRARLETGELFAVRHGYLDRGSGPNSVWRLASEHADAWLATVASKTRLTFGDVGSVRVGIKTTADSVFIRSDWHERFAGAVPELLRPLTTHHQARRFRAGDETPRPDVLYTHELRSGRRAAVNLDRYPLAARYLGEHRDALTSRRYVRDAGREWFEIWVPHDPSAWSAPKLVWRDIAEHPVFWFDDSGSVVNGDCYWMVANRGDSSLLWLALAVANSTFIEAFYDNRFNNRLYARRRRFITQYVREFPLPDPTQPESRHLASLAQMIYARKQTSDTSGLESELDALVWDSFGLQKEVRREPDLELLV